MKIKTIITALFVAVLCFGVLPSMALAQENDGESDELRHEEVPSQFDSRREQRTERQDKRQATRQEAKTSRQNQQEVKHEEKKTQLNEERQKRCEQRKSKILEISQRIEQRGQKHFVFYNNVTTRVQEFYEKKELRVQNYDTLLGNVNTQKAHAEDAIKATKSQLKQLSCEAENPRAELEVLKEKFTVERKALQQYRQSLKKLIQSIRDQKIQNNEDAS